MRGGGFAQAQRALPQARRVWHAVGIVVENDPAIRAEALRDALRPRRRAAFADREIRRRPANRVRRARRRQQRDEQPTLKPAAARPCCRAGRERRRQQRDARQDHRQEAPLAPESHRRFHAFDEPEQQRDGGQRRQPEALPNRPPRQRDRDGARQQQQAAGPANAAPRGRGAAAQRRADRPRTGCRKNQGRGAQRPPAPRSPPLVQAANPRAPRRTESRPQADAGQHRQRQQRQRDGAKFRHGKRQLLQDGPARPIAVGLAHPARHRPKRKEPRQQPDRRRDGRFPLGAFQHQAQRHGHREHDQRRVETDGPAQRETRDSRPKAAQGPRRRGRDHAGHQRRADALRVKAAQKPRRPRGAQRQRRRNRQAPASAGAERRRQHQGPRQRADQRHEAIRRHARNQTGGRQRRRRHEKRPGFRAGGTGQLERQIPRGPRAGTIPEPRPQFERHLRPDGIDSAQFAPGRQHVRHLPIGRHVQPGENVLVRERQQARGAGQPQERQPDARADRGLPHARRQRGAHPRQQRQQRQNGRPRRAHGFDADHRPPYTTNRGRKPSPSNAAFAIRSEIGIARNARPD